MTRAQLEHIIRAASTIADDDELIIVGSQAILGQFPTAPPALLVSVEADVYPKNYPERSELIDGSLGELSPFHETFGYYAQGVEPGTAILPLGWEERLIPLRTERTRGATGWCLEVHDLALSKYAAGREKDAVFLREVIKHGLVDGMLLRARLRDLPVSAEHRERIERSMTADLADR